MVGHYERRWSGAARWCERTALVSVPYFVLTILLHRFDWVTTPQAMWLSAFGIVLILASLLLGVRALFDLWNRGDRGGKATIRGVVLATLMLIPFIWYGYLALEHPLLADVSTNPFNPPQYLAAGEVRERLAGQGATPLADYDDAYVDTILSEYPGIGSRRYNAGPERVLAAVRLLVEERAWKIAATSGLPEAAAAEPPAQDAAREPAAEPAAEEPADEAPQNFLIEAVARTFVFGFVNDVLIVIEPEAEATLVDMRSSSRFGSHDFGHNAALIEKFLADLDAALVGIAGEG